VPQDVLRDNTKLYIISTFCKDGQLLDAVQGARRFKETKARFWIKPVFKALENLQAMGLSHGNISLENILVHNDTCALIDFGQCRRVPVSAHHQRLLMAPQGQCGAAYYMPLEIANDQLHSGFAVGPLESFCLRC